MDSNAESKKNENMSIKKSVFKILVISIIVSSLIAVFFAGSYASLKSEQVTKSELNEAIAKIEAKMSNQQKLNQPDTQPIKISTDDDPIRGNKDAPVTIVEFSDFQCPFCARFHTQTLPLILEQYINTGKVKLVYRDFPLQNSHPNAMAAAVAAECAHEQDKYWEYHDTLFENQGVWNKANSTSTISIFENFATELELNQEQFNTCLNSGKYVSEINNDLRDGRDYGVTGTPGFFVGSDEKGFVKIDGAQPFEVFKSVIDTQLNT